jgi:UDP-N-acetylglucosamine 2-epimerase
MKKTRLVTVVGTRPELIRLSRVICELDAFFDHILVHTGQNYDYELNEIFFSDLDIRKPNYFLNAAEMTSSQTIGSVISKSDVLFRKIKPDAMFVLGDTNSSLATISAKKLKIPIFHYEAGNRSFDQRVPEEINRKIVDHISDIHFTYSAIAREALIREGVPSQTIFNIGSPMLEVISFYKTKIQQSTILKKLNLKAGNYFLISFHREENVDNSSNLLNFSDMVNQLADQYKLPIIISTHPRTKKKILKNKVKFNKLVRLSKPFAFSDYIQLQISSKAVLSDSGTISEESSILDFPAINLRESHERPEAMEEAVVPLVGVDANLVLEALNMLLLQKKDRKIGERIFPIVKDYNVPIVSKKISRLILSYISYVNNFIWKKN